VHIAPVIITKRKKHVFGRRKNTFGQRFHKLGRRQNKLGQVMYQVRLVTCSFAYLIYNSLSKLEIVEITIEIDSK
jgi:hypothetical protein